MILFSAAYLHHRWHYMVNSDPMGCTHRQLKTKKWHIRSDINIHLFFHVFNIHFTTLLVINLAGT